VQKEHLKAEHAARLHFLQGQAREVDIRRLGLRLRVGFQLFLVLIATAIGAGLLVVVYDAFHSRIVIINSFEIAPGLTAPVPNGKIVAAQLLDRLAQLQAATRISAQKRGLSNAWTNEISIDVPETGVSLSQLEHVLKARFGHDERIDGDVVRSEYGGLTLTVRGTGILPKSFTDQGGHLDGLVNQAAEYVYGESEPGLFAKYLVDTNRLDEAITLAKTHLPLVSQQEQPYLLNYWGNAILAKAAPDASTQALSLYREAVRLNPEYWVGYNNIINALGNNGDVEGAIRLGERMMELAGGRPGKASEVMYGVYDSWVSNLQAQRAGQLADLVGTGGTSTTQSGADGLSLAQTDVYLHEPDTARLRLQTTVWDEQSSLDAGPAAFAQAVLAEELGAVAAAASAWDAYVKAYADPVVAAQFRNAICYAALTYEKTGQSQKADAALNAVGTFTFPDCYAFRADLLDLRGDWKGAQEWYAKAVKLAPSFPGSYHSWGLALAKHNDLPGAVEQFRLANVKGPTWADPLKAWGDVLVKQGKTKDALAKYDEALMYAPNWKQLKEAREVLAKQSH
jgi:pentatricopeptide repeat protein